MADDSKLASSVADVAPAKYSWYEVVMDGSVTAPRWIHHIAIKLCTQHTATSFLALVLLSLLPHTAPVWLGAYGVRAFELVALRPAIAATLVGGPIVYAYIIGRKIYHGLKPNWPDWIHDAALAFAPFAGGLILSGDRVGGALLLGACIATWRQLHRRAIP